MGQLGDQDRGAVVLRFFGGKSFAEVATAAGVSENAAKKRVGRLVVWDKKTGKAIEPKFEPWLGLIEDTDKKVSGPIWVRGGHPGDFRRWQSL